LLSTLGAAVARLRAIGGALACLAPGALAACAFLSACSAEAHSRRADRAAQRLLEERDRAVLDTREAETRQPERRAPEPPKEASPTEGEDAPEGIAEDAVEPAARVLDLRAALAVAYTSNRQMLARREGLELEALSLLNTRHAFAPQLALALAYVFDDGPTGTPDVNSGSARFSLSQVLATGARLALEAASSGAASEGDSGDYDSLVSLSLAQPLLRGAGHAISHEPLVQAERSLVYTLREFELFREGFSIEVARQFYGLVNRKQAIGNQQRNLDNNEFGRRQAEALFAVGRANELDVLRARRSELTARNALLEAREGLELALDTFRIFLGLPEDQPIDVRPDPPTFTPVDYDLRSALEVAEVNRLDLRNRVEQLEDVERGVRLSANALLPDLDLVLGASYATTEGDTFGGSELERSDASLALTLGVPLDRVRERNAYRSAQLGLARARRDLEEFRDQLRVSIQSSFRELERRLQSLEIQRQLIADQTKNLRIAELQFERGKIENRDVVEASQSLLDAENALIDEQVNYEIARLELLSALGILFIDETGMWK
jgi:outer membrane protein TolC